MYKRMVSTKYAGQKEYERAIVEGNRELIGKYEENIQKVIARVWEG